MLAGVRTIDWVDGAVEIVDQTALPGTTRILRLSTVDELVSAVRRLAVRGAPAIGVAGAFGVALAARLHDGEALAVRDEEIASSAAMARLGADLVTSLCGPRPRLLTHCNTGALATVVGGTALSVAFELHGRGALGGVVASETRPLLQGARLTAWELGQAGIGYRIAVDGAGPFLMARGEVDAVIVGADRICANGDVVNKVGTYAHALGARAAGIPFVAVAPESTVDMDTPSGAAVEIEDRGAAEVLSYGWVPEGADAVNPAFDVTPAALVTAIVTDQRVVRLDRGEKL